MSRFLIDGRAGSGKSAINGELRKRGYNSHDADDFPGLASWVDTRTKEPVEVDPSKYVDYSRVDWDWDGEVLKKVIAENPNLFLCGSASNDLDFFNLFDRVFILTIDPARQLESLQTRNSPYAKDSRQQQETIKDQADFVDDALKLGAVAIENSGTLEEVVDKILASADV